MGYMEKKALLAGVCVCMHVYIYLSEGSCVGYMHKKALLTGVCVYVCMYICICQRARAWDTCIQEGWSTYVDVCVYVCISSCVGYMGKETHPISVCVYLYICIYIYIYIYI